MLRRLLPCCLAMCLLVVLVSSLGLDAGSVAAGQPQPAPTLAYKVGIQAGHWPKAGAASCAASHPGDATCERCTVGEMEINKAVRDRVVSALRVKLGSGWTVDALDAGSNEVPNGYAADVLVAVHCDWCETDNPQSAGYKVARHGGIASLGGKDGSGDLSDQLVDLLYEHYGGATGLGQDRLEGHFTAGMLNYYALGAARSAAEAIIELGWLYRDYQVIADSSAGGGQDKMAQGIVDAVMYSLVLRGAPVGNDLAVSEQSDFAVAFTRELVPLRLVVKNTGYTVWSESEGYSMANAASPLGGPTVQHLTANVPPGGTASWDWTVVTPASWGIHRMVWQMKRGDVKFGPPVVFHLVVLPPQARELKESIEKQIREWKAQGQRKVEELVERLTREIEEWVRREAEKRAKGICPGLVGWLVLPVAAVALGRRTR